MSSKQERLRRAKRILGSYEKAAESVGRELGSQDSSEGLESLAPEGPVPSLEGALEADRNQQVDSGLRGMQKLDVGREDLSPSEQQGLEAIILLTGRPAFLVQDDDFPIKTKLPEQWSVLDQHRAQITNVLKRVGRIEVSGSPNFEWLGTGFLAGEDVVITNRHVAIEFAERKQQRWDFKPAMGSSVDFNREHLSDADPAPFEVKEVIGIHDTHDMALLRVGRTSGTQALADPLPVSMQSPGSMVGRKIYVVGYPAWDGRRNDPEPMMRIFKNVFNVKRLQPGEISEPAGQFEIFHDCSTLGGNSGSPVIDLETHAVIGLHFGGRFMEKNHAIPLWLLQQDALVKEGRLNFV